MALSKADERLYNSVVKEVMLLIESESLKVADAIPPHKALIISAVALEAVVDGIKNSLGGRP